MEDYEAGMLIMLFMGGFIGFALGIGYGATGATPEYQTIALEVASEHTYTVPSYVCGHFSLDLTKALREQGYFAMEKTVKLNDFNGLHDITLLILPIESTNGTILTPNKWKEGGYSFFGDAYNCQRCMKTVEEAINCPEHEGQHEKYNLETGLCEYWNK